MSQNSSHICHKFPFFASRSYICIYMLDINPFFLRELVYCTKEIILRKFCIAQGLLILKTIYNQDTIALTETFVLVFTNHANEIIGYNIHSSGTIASTQVEIRLIMAIAINCACSGVIISHNHPSGSMSPSKSDRLITDKINQALEVFNIKLLDHIIVSPNRGDYYSFADNGILC